MDTLIAGKFELGRYKSELDISRARPVERTLKR